MFDPFPRLYRSAVDALKTADRVFVIAHRDPDGDALGSVLAAGELLIALGIRHDLAAATPPPLHFSFLPGYERLAGPEAFGEHDAVLLLDVGDVERSSIAEAVAAKRPGVTVVNVDHHPTRTAFQGKEFVDVSVVDRRASSTAEMIHRMFEAAGVALTREAAQCIATGIVTDTGMLQNAATSSEAFEVLGRCMVRGADLQRVLRATFRNKPVPILKLWGRALSRLRVDAKTGYVSTVLTKKDFEETGADDNAAEGIANFMNGIEGAKVSVVVKDKGEGIVKTSLRTTDPAVNVAEIAAKYGGGGHPKAAGFSVPGKVVETETGYAVVPA